MHARPLRDRIALSDFDIRLRYFRTTAVAACWSLPCLLAFPSGAQGSWFEEVPFSEEEELAITRLARSELAPDFLEVEFESVTILKTLAEYQIDVDDPRIGRTERLRFYGTFSESIRTEDYRERYAIRCSISTYFVESEVTRTSERCEQGNERYLRYEGVASEVLLDEHVELDLAKTFLDFLETQIGPVRGQPFVTQEDFSAFDRIRIPMGRPKRIAVHWSCGGSVDCGFSFVIMNENPYEFGLRQDISIIND